jgi:prepilin-type N-terminal cleavage/methylation domain-containing protein
MAAAAKKHAFLPPAARGGPVGFTLVEVIATLIIVGIVSAFFMNFMGSAMRGSSRALEYVRGEAGAEDAVEKIVADFVEKTNQDAAGALGLMKTAIDNKNYDDSAAQVQVTAAYIAFDGGGNAVADSAGLNRTLKVTVKVPGNDMFVLLTKSRGSDSPPVVY